MAGEIIGEIIMFVVEAGMDIASDRDKKDGCGIGCLIGGLILVGILVACYIFIE